MVVVSLCRDVDVLLAEWIVIRVVALTVSTRDLVHYPRDPLCGRLHEAPSDVWEETRYIVTKEIEAREHGRHPERRESATVVVPGPEDFHECRIPVGDVDDDGKIEPFRILI